jgi:hypothetical protein
MRTRPRVAAARRGAWRGTFACALLLLIGPAVPAEEKKAEAAGAARVEDMSQGPIQVILRAEPGRVEYDKDILLTIAITAPQDCEITMPKLDDRLSGFVLSGGFVEEPATRDGKTTTVRHAQLTPILSAEHRIAPMAIQYADTRRHPPETRWFATRPMVFETVSPVGGKVGRDIKSKLKPVWIWPPWRTMALYAACAVGGAGLLAVLWMLLRRLHRHVQLMRLSPRERALRELDALLGRDLIGRNLVKEFYIELTLVVRRYVERAHAIRAPEQTTEEFLASASRDPRFTAEVVRRLKAFLEAADLVKFAAHRPDSAAVTRAVGTAREYVETDTAADGLPNPGLPRATNSTEEPPPERP